VRCFFDRYEIGGSDEIENLNALRWEDQQEIIKKCPVSNSNNKRKREDDGLSKKKFSLLLTMTNRR
jgi:hypothetical protein